MNRVSSTNSTLNIIHHQDRHQRTKDLINDRRVLRIWNLNDSNFHEILRFIDFSANQNLAPCLIKHLLDSVEMSFVDYPAEIFACLLAIGVKLLESNLQLLQESRQNLLLDHNIVLTHAHLTGIEQFAP